jgi:hypothetical protein
VVQVQFDAGTLLVQPLCPDSSSAPFTTYYSVLDGGEILEQLSATSAQLLQITTP